MEKELQRGNERYQFGFGKETRRECHE